MLTFLFGSYQGFLDEAHLGSSSVFLFAISVMEGELKMMFQKESYSLSFPLIPRRPGVEDESCEAFLLPASGVIGD